MLYLEPLSFKFRNRTYKIEFNNTNILQILGDSAVGKSLFVQDARDAKHLGLLKDILIIDKRTEENLRICFRKEELKKYKTVIIDNLDILMTDELEEIIGTETDIYWILIGRNCYRCAPFYSRGELRKINGVITIDYTKNM